MLAYYAIKFKSEGIRIEGPHSSWQAACLAGFRKIDSDMLIKCLGGDSRIAANKSRVREAIFNPEGWFWPYLPDSSLGFTLDPEKALGPPEIAAILLGISKELKAATTASEVFAVQKKIQPLLRYIPISLGKKFDDLCNMKLSQVGRGNHVE